MGFTAYIGAGAAVVRTHARRSHRSTSGEHVLAQAHSAAGKYGPRSGRVRTDVVFACSAGRRISRSRDGGDIVEHSSAARLRTDAFYHAEYGPLDHLRD